MKTKTAATDGLGVALVLLRLTSAASDAFPPLKIAASGALFILDTSMKFIANKQEWVNLGEYVASAMACVIESLPESKEPREDLRSSIEKLADAMDHIQQEIRSIQQQSGFARALAFGKDPERIVSMRKELDGALSLFHLKTALTTALDVAEILDGVKIEQLLGRASSKLSNTIVSAMNLNAIPCAEGASWDPNPNNACLPNTRVELLKEVMAWVESPDHEHSPRLLWLSSVAGGGKTAVANTVAKLCHDKGLLAASFFFDRKTAGRNDPKRLFSTLARGLANYSPECAAEIHRAIEDDQSVATSPIFRQFEELIRVPSLRYSGRKPITFVVDALDEGLTAELLQILRDEFPKLPDVFRILVTSRPESQIVSFLANQPQIRRATIDIQGQFNEEDLSIYAERELREVAVQRSLSMEWPGAELLKEFIAKAGGLFIWVSVVSRYLCRISFPEKKLALLLSKSGSHTFTAEAQMDEIYSSILETCDWEDEDFVEGYRLFFGAIMAARTPLSIDALQLLHRSPPLQIEEILRPIGSLILSDLHGTAEPVKILHLSLQEFVTSRTQLSPCFEKFHLGIKEQSQRLAHLCLTVLNTELNPVIPGVGFLHRGTPESELPGIPDLNATNISEALSYACQFWMDHLMDVDAPDKPLLDELQTFLSRQLARWLEILTGKGLFQNIERVREWIDRTASNRSNSQATISASSTATLFLDLSERLTYMDRREDALCATEQTVALRRQVADDIPALARSISAFSICLTAVGRREEALEADEEALALFYQLVDENPVTFNIDLANCLHNRSISLANVGRREDALDASELAVPLYRQLASGNPAAFNPGLASSLNNLSLRLSDLELEEDALDIIQMAVALRRELAADHPTTFNSDLAMSLNNLSNRLSNLGRQEDALNTIKEVVELYRKLATDCSATSNHDLAMSLNNLSIRFSDLGHLEEAQDAIQEAVTLYSQLAAHRPAVYNSEFAASLNNLSNRLSDLGRHEEALEAMATAVALRRELATERPAAFEPGFAQSLNNLSRCLSNLGRQAAALESMERAVELRQKLAADRPAVFNSDLALSLRNLCLCLSHMGRWERALAAIEQAVKLYRKLAEEHPTTHKANLADSLNWLSTCLTNLGRNEDALQATEEAQRLSL